MANQYEQKQEQRRQRLLDAADKADREAKSRLKSADDQLSVIPMGQPILVGHHSEKRHRRDLNRIHNNIGKGTEAQEKAKQLRGHAASVGKGGVSSDDPDAIQKLSEKLEKLKMQPEQYRNIGKALRKAGKSGDDAPLKALGLRDETIAGLKQPDFAGNRGIPSYILINDSSNMRRIRERIEALKATAEDQTRPCAGLRDSHLGQRRRELSIDFLPRQARQGNTSNTQKLVLPNVARTADATQRHRSSTALYWARRACNSYA